MSDQFRVGERVSLSVLRGKAFGIGGARGYPGSYRKVRGKVIYSDHKLFTVLNDTGYREAFLYIDFGIGQAKIDLGG